MAERDNIIIGAARFWISDPDTPTSAFDYTVAEPTIPEGTAAVTLTDYRELGFTTEGVEVSYEPDYADVEVDQLLDSAIIFKQGMRVTVNTTLAEATLENLLVAWGQAGTTLVGEAPAENRRLAITSGELGDFPIERSLLFQGPSPRGGDHLQRWYYLGRAIQTESSAFALRRAEATTLPASFRCLPDETGEYGAIIDRSITAEA